jgi:adenine-specific DNA-methyltransferase
VVQQSDLLDQANNIREEGTAEDLLFQIMVDWGIDLALPLSTEVIVGKPVLFVDKNALAACFETDLSEELITTIAKRREHGLPLLKVVFRDAGYRTDSVKINVEQIFKQLSPTTEVRTF